MRTKQRVQPAKLNAVLLELCRGRALTLSEMADFTGRAAETLRIHYLAKLVANGEMRLKYPEKPTHPAQAYMTAEE